MKARPILFSAEMIRALLDGRKTVTRRIVKPQPKLSPHHEPVRAETRGDRRWVFMTHTDRPEYSWATGGVRCPYGEPGDALTVKESAWMWCERVPNGVTKTGRAKWHYVPMREAPIHYAADHPSKPVINVVSPDTGNQWGWRLKVGRFLPAWASRLTLRITNIRVERLQDISYEDAVAEGCGIADMRFEPVADGETWEQTARRLRWPQRTYEQLWNSINGAQSWAANPWCWCISFTCISKNVDEVLRDV